MKNALKAIVVIVSVFTALPFFALKPDIVRAADRPIMQVWTETSYNNVFKHTVKPPNAADSIRLTMAKNEYEAAQIALRSTYRFTINSVTFSALSSGVNTIAAGNLESHFVEYENLTGKSNFIGWYISNAVEDAPGLFPDALSNSASLDVAADTTQPIWVKAYVPANAAAGTYTGTATVNTTAGVFRIPLTVNVGNVAIPDSKDGTFNNTMWMKYYREISWSNELGENIKQLYGWDVASPQWWALMEDYAAKMKEYRLNNLPVNFVDMLLDGGSSLDANGTYSFDWSRFDQVVQFFIDRNAVKRIEGLFMSQRGNMNANGSNLFQTEMISRDADGNSYRNWAPWDSAASDHWIDQFIPALKAHLEAKGWDAMFWMHVGDEPSDINHSNAWNGLASRIRTHWSSIKLGDAMSNQAAASPLTADIWIPVTMAYDDNQAFYDGKKAAGKELWFYTANVPTGPFLSRFIDQPVWLQRSLMWYAYERGITGYLHWGHSQWTGTPPLDVNANPSRGDSWIVKPDPANNKLKATIRYEALRDGIEDYELLKILESSNPDMAKGLASSIAEISYRYTKDVNYMIRMRSLLVHAAASGGTSGFKDNAMGKSAAASSQTSGFEAGKTVDKNSATGWQSASGSSPQWLQIDLGAQHQVDAVKLKWGVSYATAYQIQTSYDGNHWADVVSVAGGNGGDDFAGVNAKGRYVRIFATTPNVPGGTYSLISVEVAGFRLDKPNLAAGKTYTISVPPNAERPDTNFESTDGVPGGHFEDGRTWGNQLLSGTHLQNVIIDLGSMQNVNEIKVKKYDNVEYRYAPEWVEVFTSADGKNYISKGKLTSANSDYRTMYDFTFPHDRARYLKVSMFKTYSPDTNWLMVDEIEAYGSKGDGERTSQY